MLLELFFWLLLLGILYTYLGYGVLAWFWVRGKGSKLSPVIPLEWPKVSLVVPAYNEEAILAGKIRNCLDLDYPMDRLQVIVVTDGSTDGSSRIAQGFGEILHLHEPTRKGKIVSVNRAVKASAGAEILVFTDANTMLNREALKRLVVHYGDPLVGGVSGEKKVRRLDGVAGEEGAYWRYESALKKLDAAVYSVVGAAGELFSMRARLYHEVPGDVVLDDFYLSMKICEAGYRVEYEPAAVAEENPSISLADERERKIRISAGAFQAMQLLGHLANPLRYGLLGVQFLSRRIMRWVFCPLALPLALIINMILVYIQEPPVELYTALLVLQVVFYLLALAGWIWAAQGRRGVWIISLPYYFIFMNLSVWLGLFRYLNGGQSVVWQKASRQ